MQNNLCSKMQNKDWRKKKLLLHFRSKFLDGFTLLELLIALFIFSMLSTLLVSALENIISAYSGTEKNSARLQALQRALLIMSRDIEQTINRPIINARGALEAAFIGTPRTFTFTQIGFPGAASEIRRSAMQRTNYAYQSGAIYRSVETTLDKAPQSSASSSISSPLIDNIVSAQFQYLDQKHQLHSVWPVSGEKNALPSAVKINLTIFKWGSVSQLYVIAAGFNPKPPEKNSGS